MAVIVSADELKKTLPNYTPEKAEQFHHVSARMADKHFSAEVKKNKDIHVILMNGGTASGKTEFLATQLVGFSSIIFDATQSTILGAKNKIHEIFGAHKIPIIYAVLPDDLRRAYIAFLNRDRKFSDVHFYRTHSKSRETLLWIANQFPEIAINIIESSYSKTQKLSFERLEFSNRFELIHFLEKIQMTETDILQVVTKA